MEPNPHAAVESCANLRKKLSKDELRVDALVSPSPPWLQWYKVSFYCRGWSPNYTAKHRREVYACAVRRAGWTMTGGGGCLLGCLALSTAF